MMEPEIFEFQSTSSVWRTTDTARRPGNQCIISIHVLRVEDDVRYLIHLDDPDISIHVLRVEDDGRSKAPQH